MMNFDNIVDFGDFVAENIKQFLPAEMQDLNFNFLEVQKANGISLYGLEAINTETNLSPNVYLNGAFDDVTAGKLDPIAAVKQLAGSFGDAYLNPSVRGFNLDSLNDFEVIKAKIMPELVNLDRSIDFLNNKPHDIVGDLAKIYKINLVTTDLSKASITVTNELLDFWGVSKDTLDQVAMENLSFESFQFQSLPSFLAKVMGISEEEMNIFFPLMDPTAPPIYVLTNEKADHGAIGIINRPIMDKISAELGSDLVVLPSSIHEVLVLPFNFNEKTKDINVFKDMVKEVNASEVSVEEFLSDNVYVYDAKEHELMFGEKYVDRLHMKENARDFENLDQKTINVIMGDGRPAGSLISELNSNIDLSNSSGSTKDINKDVIGSSAKKHDDTPIGG